MTEYRVFSKTAIFGNQVVRELLRKEISAGLAAPVSALELGTKGRIAAVAISVAIVLWLCAGIGTITVF